ncbi:hypothetical protein SDJN03_19641, partial [Cucurbita argyrosperma subsp. sororia]
MTIGAENIQEERDSLYANLWSSMKQQIISRSSMEAKFRCLANAATNLVDSSLLTFNSEFLAHLSATTFKFVFKSVLNPIRPS